VNVIYKKLRSKKKKLDKIKDTEDKAKKGDAVLTQEQLEMIKNKNAIVEEMNELQNIIKMYQEAFPDL
jgi:ribosomal protein S17